MKTSGNELEARINRFIESKNRQYPELKLDVPKTNNPLVTLQSKTGIWESIWE